MIEVSVFPKFEPYPEERYLFRVEFDSRAGVSGVEYLISLDLLPSLLRNYGMTYDTCDLRIETYTPYYSRKNDEERARLNNQRLVDIRKRLDRV